MVAELVSIFEAGDYEALTKRAAEALWGGGIVILPTETVYGAAGMLGHAGAMERLRGAEGQSGNKPLVIHLPNRDAARQYIGEVGEMGQRMMRKLWPGPVALVFDVPGERQEEVARRVGVPVDQIYEEGTITLRCPDHVVATDVLGQVEGPVVLRKVRSSFEATGPIKVDEPWQSAADLILDAGPTQYHKPSTIVKVKDDGFEVLRAGVYDQRIIERLLRTTILFVCSGNTCRSPMAEAIARQMLAKRLNVKEEELEQKGVTVLSAGSFAMPGSRAAAPAIEVMRGMGADLSKHRSRPLSVELIHQADVVYTMSRSHAQAVVALSPSSADKVMMLDPRGDIDDPVGGDVALYESVAGELRDLIEKRLAEQSIP